MNLMLLLLFGLACLYTPDQVFGVPIPSEDSANCMVALPRVLMTSTNHTIVVEDWASPSRSMVLTIDSLRLGDGTVHKGTPTVIRNGQGKAQYSIPFKKFIEDTLNITVTLAECSDEKCTPGKQILQRRITMPVVKNTPLVFIETSKPIYKPGDTIKFRLLPITAESLKPENTRFDLVYLQSPKMRMAQWRNVTWLTALRGLSYNLSADPLFGKWRVVAVVDGVKDYEEFKVAKYVLPRFTVSIKTPTYVFAKDEFVQFQVCPTYSTGLPMKATIKAQFCIRPKRINRWTKLRPCVDVSNKTDGITRCLPFNISTERLDLINGSYTYWGNLAFVNASVIEQGTNQTVNKTEFGGGLTFQAYKIVNESPNTFSQRLPFYGRVRVLNHDDSPRPNVRLSASVAQYWYGWSFKKDYTSNADGVIDFSIPPFPDAVSSVSIQFKDKFQKQLPYQRGIARVTVPSLYHTVRNTYSPSKTYMQVFPLSRMKPQDVCNTGKLTVRLHASVPLQDKSIKVIASSRTGMQTIQSFSADGNIKESCQDADSDEIGHFVCVPSATSDELPKIRCLKGWRGLSCRTPICKSGCFKGVCTRPDVCSCRDGWSGPTCNKCVIRKSCKNGCCSYGNDCRCQVGYVGYLCDKKTKIKHRPPICADNTKLGTTPEPYDPSQLEELRIFSREVTIDISDDLYPSARLVIWFVHQGPNQTELVTSSINLPNLKKCLAKSTPTSIRFTSDKVRPGEKTAAVVKTTGKDVRCALAISDVALETFGTRGGVSQAQLSSDLDKIFNQITGGWVQNDPYNQMDDRQCGMGYPYDRRRKKRMILPWNPSKVDSSTGFKNAGILVLADFPLVTSPCENIAFAVMYDADTPMASGAETASLSAKKKSGKKEAKKALKTRLRTFFPETWLFELLENPTKVPLTAPDSMTTWKATAYCVSSAGLGIAEPSRLTVLQPFFLQMALPYSLIRGETAKVPVKVFSYLKGCIEIELTMKPSADLDSNGQQRATGCLCNFEQITAYFRVKPKKLGRVPIEVHAQSRSSDRCARRGKSKGEAVSVSDAVRRDLLVEPEGLPEQMSFGDLFCPSSGSKSATFAVKTPSDNMDIVPDTARAYVSWTGTVLGSSMDNLERLVKMPYGCGEQNMMSVVPSIYILDFFTKAGISKPTVAEKARRYISIGYQRQLKYRLNDGSYSAFGERDVNGSTWLTAFVFKSFVAASRYSDIDPQVLTSALTFLMNKTRENGCFREDGRVFSSMLKGGISQGADEVSITAYVLSALVEARAADPSLVNATATGIESALRCLTASTNDTGLQALSTYAIAVRAYALRSSSPALLKQYRAELDTRATREDGFVYWRGREKEEKKSGWRPWYRYTSADVETTAYALLSRLQEVQSGSDLIRDLPTVRWLTSQRNELGGWYSTQDTVMGLQAVTDVASRLSAGDVQLTIATEKEQRKVNINKDNRLVLSQMPVSVPSELTVTATGAGCAVVQTNLLFNVRDIGRPGAPFTLTATVSQRKGACDRSKLKVCVSYTGPGQQSGMAVVKTRMASGWRVPIEELDRLTSGDVKRTEIEEDESLLLYFDSFSAKDTCVTFEVERLLEVSALQPMLVQVYDYYRPEQTQESSVAVVTDVCAKEVKARKECPRCFNGDSSEAAVQRLCSTTQYFAAAERKTKDKEKWSITYPVGDMILAWRGALRMPSGCECRLGQRVLVAVHTQYWRYNFDEDLIMDDFWTVVDVDALSDKGRTMLTKSCLAKSEGFNFAYRTLRPPKEEETETMKPKEEKKKTTKPTEE